MKTVGVVEYFGATAKSHEVVASICADLRDQGLDIHLLNLDSFGVVRQQHPPAWVVRLLGHRVYSNRFHSLLAEMKVTIHQLSRDARVKVHMSPQEKETYDTAVESELLTYFRRESLQPATPWMRTLRRLLDRNATEAFSALVSSLNEVRPDLLLVPNGRTSRQKVARLAAEKLGIPLEFYENGRARADSYYRGKTQPHDRIASQQEVPKVVSSTGRKACKELAEAWLDTRTRADSGTNSFSSGWDEENHSLEISDREIAVFFTSSADEFLAFGPMWRIDDWNTQFQAFDLAMGLLEKRGVELWLRVHPNLTKKSRQYFKKTVAELQSLQIRHPSLKIIWHTSRTNSYDLVRSATYVIAERSTIGLEANLMGKPVWINQASQWDLVADVRQVLEPSHITDEVFRVWEVDTRGAQDFVAYWMLQESPLRYSWDEFTTWNPESPPLRLRAAKLLAKNPLRHRLQLLLVEASQWANGRARF